MSDIIPSGTTKLRALVTAPPADEMQVIAERIRSRIRRTTTDIIDTGRDLLTVKAQLEHGEFIAWIEREFQMTDRTARNYMQAAEWAVGKSEIVSVLPPATVYKLASPSTPDPIKQAVIADLSAGRAVDHREVEKRIKAERAERARVEAERAGREWREANKKSAAARRRREEQRLKEEEEFRAKRDRGYRIWAERLIPILRKLERADAEELLKILMGQGYGTPEPVLRHARQMLGDGAA